MVSQHAREAAYEFVRTCQDYDAVEAAFDAFERATVERCAAFLEQQDGHGEWHEAAAAIRAQVTG